MTWEEFEKEIEFLVSKITIAVDVIVPIARGGLVPGRMLATKLHVKTMYVVTIEKSENKRQVATDIKKDLNDRTVLLVEDMLETGQSMLSAKEYLETKGANVLTACFYIMPQTKTVPDFYIRKVSDIVSFPWE